MDWLAFMQLIAQCCFIIGCIVLSCMVGHGLSNAKGEHEWIEDMFDSFNKNAIENQTKLRNHSLKQIMMRSTNEDNVG